MFLDVIMDKKHRKTYKSSRYQWIVNKSGQDDSDAPRSQSLDKLDNFWTDLNEATVMLPVAKAQIYSVKQKLTSKIKSLECEASLINLKELVEKRREKAKSSKKCKGIVNYVVLDVYQVFPVPYNLYL